MFFVFGPSGQMYRGGPENLARISAVRSVQRPQALRTRAMDAQDGQPGPVFTAPPRPTAADTNAAAPTAIVNLRMHDAVSAYAQTEQGPQATTTADQGERRDDHRRRECGTRRARERCLADTCLLYTSPSPRDS